MDPFSIYIQETKWLSKELSVLQIFHLGSECCASRSGSLIP
jgi:hypothetical protein